MEKDKLIASLLQPAGSGMRGGGPLIQPLDEAAETNAAPSALPAPPASEGPSLLEQMMALQREARKEQELEKDKEVKKTTATFGNGFKKGFFGGGGGGGAAAASFSSTMKQHSAPAPAVSQVTQHVADIPTIRPTAKRAGGSSKSNSLVIEEVQSALKEEDHALLRDLKAGQWVTPDLTQLMMGNEILARGLRNPRCTAAIELMQRDPKEAQRRFKGDPEVDLFLREFGKVMAAHFESLSQKQPGEKEQQQAPEVGPLHAEVLRRAEAEGGAKKKIVETSTEEENRVKEVLNDPELRDFLMDPELQRILQECGDPITFQRHMQDPATAYKIKRLFDSGLVGTAKDV